MNNANYDVIIAGTGPAGITAAIYAQRMGLQTVVFGDLPGGITYMIEHLANFPGLMPETSGTQFGTMAFQQANQEGATFPLCLLESLSLSDGTFRAVDVNGQGITATAAIVASGRTPKRLEVENSQVRGVHFCSICDGPLYRDKGAVLAVVGGGNPAAQHTLALARVAKHVYLVCRSRTPGCDSAHLRKLEQLANVSIMTQAEVVAFKGLDELQALVVAQPGRANREIAVSGIFQAIGWQPNTAFLDLQIDKTADGYLKTDQHLMTSVSGLFAAGDVRDTDMWQVLTACADGARAAKYVSDYLGPR
jgi:thioredoxin reductase (NADPH)